MTIPVEHPMFEMANQLAKLGVSVIPIEPGTKEPPRGFRWGPYAERIADASERYTWFVENQWQIAVVAGGVSQNLIPLDFDGPGGFESLAAVHPIIRTYPRVRTGSGKHHIWIRSTQPTRKYVTNAPDGSRIEVRANVHYTLAPLSIHPNGEPYVWEVEPWDGIPIIDLEDIGLRTIEIGDDSADPMIEGEPLTEAERDHIVSICEPHWKPYARHDMCLGLAGWLASQGVPESDTTTIIQTLADTGGDSDRLREFQRAIRDTYKKARAGITVAGWSVLTGGSQPILTSGAAMQLDLLLRSRQPVFSFDIPDLDARDTDAPDIETDGWRDMLAQTPLDIDAMPYWIERIVRHVHPFTRMFPDDWPVMLSLPYWSALWPGARIQNLHLNVWTLGLGVQGIGKNIATDELIEILAAVTNAQSGDEVALYTAGSPEGMWEALNGDGKRMFCYHDEFAGFLKLLRRDHMQSAREALCSLYDGRVVAYHRARKASTTILNPHVAVAATTTPAAIREFAEPQDLANGYLSRFMVCAPDARQVAPDYYPSDSQPRRDLIREIIDHTQRLRPVTTIVWDGTGATDPQRLNDYREHLGMNNGALIDLDQRGADSDIPVGRLLARVKKIAALLELAEYSPNVSQNGQVVAIRAEHLETAIDIVERSYAYALRVVNWIGLSSDYELSQRVYQFLKANKEGMTQRELCRRTHAKASEMKTALELLISDGRVYSSRVGRSERWLAA